MPCARHRVLQHSYSLKGAQDLTRAYIPMHSLVWQDKALIAARREAAQHMQRVREGEESVAKMELEARAMRDQVAAAKAELDRCPRALSLHDRRYTHAGEAQGVCCSSVS